MFHNSKNAVWNAIQEAMLAAGFIVADVRTLDKQQGSYRQVTSSAVKQDLVISAYAPDKSGRTIQGDGRQGGFRMGVRSVALAQVPDLLQRARVRINR